jgi:hypothetical protein
MSPSLNVRNYQKTWEQSSCGGKVAEVGVRWRKIANDGVGVRREKRPRKNWFVSLSEAKDPVLIASLPQNNMEKLVPVNLLWFLLITVLSHYPAPEVMLVVINGLPEALVLHFVFEAGDEALG